MALPDVAQGDPHTAAHNDERHLINSIRDISDTEFAEMLILKMPDLFPDLASALAAATSAIAAANIAEDARDAAVDISNIDATDPLVEALIRGTGGVGTLVRAALADAIAVRVNRVRLLDYVNPDIGLGTDVAHDTAALDAAIAAAAARGADVELPDQTILRNTTIVLPLIGGTSNNKGVGLIGPGRHLCKIKVTTDLGAGTFAIRSSDRTKTTEYALSGFRLVGPTETRVYGTAPCAMDGIEVARRMTLDGLTVEFFRGGLRIVGDHICVARCNSSSNYFGIYYRDSYTSGDVSFIDCDLSGNVMSSIGVGIGGMLAANSFLRGHVGFSPYGIYAETGVAATASNLVVFGVWFYGTSWEAFGNAGCHDADGVGIWNGLYFNNSGSFSMYAGYQAGTSRPGVFSGIAYMRRWLFDQVGFGANGDVKADAIFSVNRITESEMRGNIADALNPYVSSGKKIISAQAGDGPDFRFVGPHTGRFKKAVSAITANRLVGFGARHGCTPYTEAQQLLGVAYNTEATVNCGVLVITDSQQVSIDSSTALSNNELVVVDPADPTKCAGISAYPTRPPIGQLWFSSLGAPGAAAICLGRIPTSTKPASLPTATTAQLAAIADKINVYDKTTGRQVFNTTTNKSVWASGTTAASVWVDATGTTAHTPI